MAKTTGYGRLAQFMKLTDKMIDEASKDAIAEAARILALQVGHYQRKCGAASFEESIALLETETLNDDEAGWVADGLEHLATASRQSKTTNIHQRCNEIMP